MRIPGLCVAVAVALAWASTADASPEDLFGWGPRSPAMGGTGAAASYGADATYTNPALLSLVHHNVLTLGYSGATFNLHADGGGLPGRVSVIPAKGFVVGAEVPIPFGGMLKDRVAVGMAFYTPTDARFPRQTSSTPRHPSSRSSPIARSPSPSASAPGSTSVMASGWAPGSPRWRSSSGPSTS